MINSRTLAFFRSYASLVATGAFCANLIWGPFSGAVVGGFLLLLCLCLSGLVKTVDEIASFSWAPVVHRAGIVVLAIAGVCSIIGEADALRPLGYTSLGLLIGPLACLTVMRFAGLFRTKPQS